MFYLNFVSVVRFLSLVLLFGKKNKKIKKNCRSFRHGFFRSHPSLGSKGSGYQIDLVPACVLCMLVLSRDGVAIHNVYALL